MHDIEMVVKDEAELNAEQKQAIAVLTAECFGDVPQKDIDEDFIVTPFKRILAYRDNQLVGTVNLFKRSISFDGVDIVISGTGGVCVTATERGKGIATTLLKKGLEILKDQQCDIACLNVDVDKKIYTLYEKLGFVMMKKEISFENVHGVTVKDAGTMFTPINSQEKYNLVMNSISTFHYGRGYW